MPKLYFCHKMETSTLVSSNRVQELNQQQDAEIEENQNLRKLQEYENRSDSEKLPKGPTEGRVLFKLLVHSLAMFTIPFCTYYCIRDYVEREYNIDTPRSYIYGAIGAVISVQIIIASYVYQAFKEEGFGKKSKKKAL